MFRLESVTYGGAEDDFFYTSRRELYFLEVPIVKATPKGHWIDYYGSRKSISTRSSGPTRTAYTSAKGRACGSGPARRGYGHMTCNVTGFHHHATQEAKPVIL